jgi:preprotein translocase subunit SecB
MAEEKKNQKKAANAKKSTAVADKDKKENQGPGFGIEKLFLRDVSVEVPNAPEIFTIHDAPLIDIELNNSAVPVSEGY